MRAVADWLIAGVVVSAIVVLSALPTPVKALGCRSIAQDRVHAEAEGFTWLGVQPVPYTEAEHAVFYARDGVVYVSPIVRGCVSNTATAIALVPPEALPAPKPRGIGI